MSLVWASWACIGRASWGFTGGVRFFRSSIWEFPKIGDPNIVPQIIGSLLL